MKTLDRSSMPTVEWYVDLRKSILLLREFVDQYNVDRPLREQLRPNHVGLVRELLELYRTIIWKRQSQGELLIPGAPLPYLATNNVQLSRRMWCTERSIQNWRERLKVAGIIQEEVWHGSNAAYEIRLNPAVLFVARKGDRMKLRAGSRGRGVWELENMEVWKSAELGVETGPERQQEQGGVPAAYGEKNAVFTEKFSPYCTLSLQDTNQLNQLDVGRCGNDAGAEGDRAGDQRRNFLTGYETDSDVEPPLSLCDISPDGERPPRVARRPPEGDNVKGDVVKPPLSFKLFVPLAQARANPQWGKTNDGLDGAKALEHVESPLFFELFVPPVQARVNSLGEKTNDEEDIEVMKDVVPGTFAETVQALPEQLGRRIFREVSKVWEVAREELYAEEWIADTERERAKARLAEYYIYSDPKRYGAGTEEICERIRLVRKWIERGRVQSPTLSRWVPIPSVYFDYRNERGFGRTKVWYKKHVAKRREIGDRIAVARAVRQYQRCLEGDGGARGPVELYQYLVKRLAGRGEDVVKRFFDAVMV